jgi:hypothetical protein
MSAHIRFVASPPTHVRVNDWRRPMPVDVLIYGLTFVPGLLILALVWFQPWVPVPFLLKDPLAIAKLAKDCCHVYYGLISNLGVLLWTATAALCLFGAILVFRIERLSAAVVFLAAAGILTGWLALDDLFMLHEDALPAFGIPEFVTYAVYAGIAALYFLFSWRQILAFRPALMALALALLGTSVLIDVLVHSPSALRVFVEDGAKFLGILAWTSFHLTAALELVAASMAQPRFIFVSRVPG